MKIFLLWIAVLISYISYLLVYYEDFANNNMVLVYYIGVVLYMGFESYDLYKKDEKIRNVVDQEFPIIRYHFLKIYISKITFQTINLAVLLFPFLFISFNIVNKDQIFQNSFLLFVCIYYFILFSRGIPKYYDVNNIEKKINAKIVK